MGFNPEFKGLNFLHLIFIYVIFKNTVSISQKTH